MEENIFNDVVCFLEENKLTATWLMGRLTEYGINVHKVTLSRWFHGEQISENARKIHDICKEIISKYEKAFN